MLLLISSRLLPRPRTKPRLNSEVGLLKRFDVLMPGISGDAVADRLRRLYPELPIVLMTGDAGVPFVATTDAPVLRKPFRHEDLVDTISGLLDED